MRALRENQLDLVATRFLEAWNTHDVDRVLSCYTDDIEYRDPNTVAVIHGADALRRYVKKLFSAWRMSWSLRESYPMPNADGATVLWRATFSRVDGDASVEVEGIDLVVLRGSRIRRNDVYFDRSALAVLSDD